MFMTQDMVSGIRNWGKDTLERPGSLQLSVWVQNSTTLSGHSDVHMSLIRDGVRERGTVGRGRAIDYRREEIAGVSSQPTFVLTRDEVQALATSLQTHLYGPAYAPLTPAEVEALKSDQAELRKVRGELVNLREKYDQLCAALRVVGQHVAPDPDEDEEAEEYCCGDCES